MFVTWRLLFFSAASFQNAPNDPCRLEFMPCVAPPTLNRADTGNQYDPVEMTECFLPGWVIKDTVAYSWLSLESLTVGEANCRAVRTLKQP